MFNLTDATIIGGAQVILTVIGVIIKDVWKDKKAAARIASVESEVPTAVKLGEEALNGVKTVVKEVLHSPEIATRVAPLEHKVSVDEAKIQESKLYHIAGIALHAYERGLDGLTKDEQATAVQYVQVELGKAGIKITEPEALVALEVIDKSAKQFIASDLFQQTQRLVAVKSKLTAASNTTSPEPETAQQ